MRIGYGRVSTRDQNPDAQHDALTAAGCDPVLHIRRHRGRQLCR
jgi:DNA invertase Pin-like site-specific DNA recombinase